MLPQLTPKQNECLEEYYIKAVDAAQISYTLAIVTEEPKHVHEYNAAMAVAKALFKLGNFERDPRIHDM